MFSKRGSLVCISLLSVIVTICNLGAYAYEYADSLGSTCIIERDSLIVHDEIATKSNHQFNAKQIILPISLITVGTFGVYNSGFRSISNSVKNGMDKIRGEHYCRIDDYMQYIPIAAYIGMDFIGIKSRHSLKERIAVGITSYLAMATIINTTKYTIKEKRPDSSALNSFPSGHTATVFTGAELIREEYGNVMGFIAYSVATSVAFLRLYNGRHWLNDVVAGAGVGILSARIGYWMLPLYQRWFRWGKANKNPMLIATPNYDISRKSVCLNLVYVF